MSMDIRRPQKASWRLDRQNRTRRQSSVAPPCIKLASRYRLNKHTQPAARGKKLHCQDMQSASLANAMSGDYSRPQLISHELILPQAGQERRNWLPTTVIIACFAITAVIICIDSGILPAHPMDQSFLERWMLASGDPTAIGSFTIPPLSTRVQSHPAVAV